MGTRTDTKYSVEMLSRGSGGGSQNLQKVLFRMFENRGGIGRGRDGMSLSEGLKVCR